MNFVDIPKTISDELCNTGGGFHEQGRESMGEAFFIDLCLFRDERFKGFGGLYFDNRLFCPLCFPTLCGIRCFPFSRHKTPHKNYKAQKPLIEKIV